MELKDFKRIKIQEMGNHYILSEKELIELLKPSVTIGNKNEAFLKVRTQLAKLVEKSRIQKKWLQHDLARESGLSLRSITNLERSKLKKKPHFKTIEFLIECFDDEFKTSLSRLMPVVREAYDNF